MERNYVDAPLAEIRITLDDGETLIALGTPNHTEHGYEMFECFIYSYEEYVQLGKPDDLPAAFYVPDSDLSAKVEGGFIKIFLKDKLLFMVNRQRVVNILSGISESLVDFMAIE